MTTHRHETHGRRRRLATLAAAALLAIVAGLVIAPGARAGVYVAVECHSEQNAGAPDAVFYRTSDHYVPGILCAGGGVGLTITNWFDTTKGGRYAGWIWRPAAGTLFTQVAAQSHIAHSAGHKAYYQVIDDAGQLQNRWPREGVFDSVDWASGAHATSFAAYLQCLLPDSQSCGSGAGAHNYVRNLWFTIRDLSAPSLALAGELLEPGPRRSTQTLNASATDAGGGVWRWRVAVNGSPAGSAEEACDIIPGGAARRFVPCPGGASRAFALDTEAPPFHGGANQLRVCVSDVGWPANEVCQERTIQVDNSCRSSGEGPPDAIDAAFPGGRDQVKLPSNRRARIGGRVRGTGAGATVCVFATPLHPGAGEYLDGEASTESGGRFDFLAPRGPSRRLRLVQRHGRHVAERELTLRVRARPRLKVGPRSRLSNGEIARFRGKLPGPLAGGRVVILQARVGSRWQAFKSARTEPDGRFRASYRFRETSARRLYRFRAVVREQAGYPYLGGVSPTRRVLVTG